VSRADTAERIEAAGVIAILRLADAGRIADVADALVQELAVNSRRAKGFQR
jgi:hypothetical protein